MDENYLENFCLEKTRGNNILDLILSNNPSLIGQVYTLISKGISDHNLVEVTINHSYTQPQKVGPKQVPYTNKFHQFDLSKADSEDWLRYETELRNIDFETITQEMNVEQKLSKLYDILEKATAKVFIKKKEFKDKDEDEENEDMGKSKPKNKIPKEIRLLMRQKKELSDRIKKSNHWLKTLRLTKELGMKEALLSEK